MQETETHIDAPTAARIAAAYLNEVMPQAEDILLEEVDKEEETRDYWLITLSFQISLSTGSGLRFGMGKRQYKVFKIAADNGEVISMKIRVL